MTTQRRVVIPSEPSDEGSLFNIGNVRVPFPFFLPLFPFRPSPFSSPFPFYLFPFPLLPFPSFPLPFTFFLLPLAAPPYLLPPKRLNDNHFTN